MADGAIWSGMTPSRVQSTRRETPQTPGVEGRQIGQFALLVPVVASALQQAPDDDTPRAPCTCQLKPEIPPFGFSSYETANHLRGNK